MALTRKYLKAMGLEDEKIDQIIEAHSETVDALKAERDSFKEGAEKAADLQSQLDKMAEEEKSSGREAYKVKYEAMKEEFDNYKNEIAAKETKAAKESAYLQLLRDAGVSDKRIQSVLRVSDLTGIELTQDGKIKDADKLTESVKAEWSDFISTDGKKGADVATPPATPAGKTYTADDIRKMSAAEINANYDAIKASLKA